MQDKYEEVLIVIIASTIVFFVITIAFAFILFFSQRKKFLHAKELTRVQQKYTEELLQAQLEIQEETLKNISQEIHDNIGQVLSLAKLNLATMDILDGEKLQVKIHDSKQLVAKAIHDLRNLSHSLDTDYVTQMGLPRALEYQLEMIKKTGSCETEFLLQGSLYKLDKQKELIIFRIVQEVLNNIIKHADAKKITIKLNYESVELQLIIIDDGQGFDLTPLYENSTFGSGIKNMHNRALIIGASFLISSTPGQGTLVTISLPITSP